MNKFEKEKAVIRIILNKSSIFQQFQKYIITLTIVNMDHHRFNTCRQFLAERIFIPSPPSLGQVWTNLNITILPDYLAYIKKILTKQQQIQLSQYHLQTYLLQAAMKPHPKNDFDFCTNQIISHIRSHPQFWLKKKGTEQQSIKMHQSIKQFNEDCAVTKELFEKQDNNQQFILKEDRKFIQDYTYISNAYSKGSHRFTATLYPWIGQYIVQSYFQSNQQRWKKEVKKFFSELASILAIKSKQKLKNYYYNFSSTSKSFSDQAQMQTKKFTQYLEHMCVDYKSLSCLKDYYIISNTILISKSLVQNINFSFEIRDSFPKRDKDLQEKIQEILSDSMNRFFNQQQIQMIVDWLAASEFHRINQIVQLRRECQQKSKNKFYGLLSSNQQLQEAINGYNQVINHPENTSRMKYKVQGSLVKWTDQQYKKFLQNFLQFFNVPTNNRKIAVSMGKGIEPNHVKHVKGIYMRNMNSRIDNGEIGGGKKGVFESKLQFLKKDIQNFNMKWFKRQDKSKTKKIKRKKKRQTVDQEQHDSDY